MRSKLCYGSHRYAWEALAKIVFDGQTYDGFENCVTCYGETGEQVSSWFVILWLYEYMSLYVRDYFISRFHNFIVLWCYMLVMQLKRRYDNGVCGRGGRGGLDLHVPFAMLLILPCISNVCRFKSRSTFNNKKIEDTRQSCQYYSMPAWDFVIFSICLSGKAPCSAGSDKFRLCCTLPDSLAIPLSYHINCTTSTVVSLKRRSWRNVHTLPPFLPASFQ